MCKRFLVLGFVIINSVNFLWSQNFDQTLTRYNTAVEKLVQIQKIDNLLDDTYDTNELLNEMRSIMNNFSALNKVQDNYRLASGYYSVLAMIKLAEIYDVNLDPEQAYATIKKVQPYVNGQINIPTPINFTYNNSNYQIKSDNLQALKNDYYRILQEMCFYRSKYDELKQVVNAQINMNSDYASTAKGIGFLLNLAFEKSIDLTTDEKIFFNTNYLKSIGNMSDIDFAKLTTNEKYLHWNYATRDLLKLLKSTTTNASINTQTTYVINALSQKNLYSVELLDLIDMTLTNYTTTSDYSGNLFVFNTNIDPYAYLLAVENIAYNAMHDAKAEKDNLNLALNILNYTLSKEKAHKAALISLTKMGDLAVSKNNCEKLQLATERLKIWKFDAEYTKYSALIAPCELAVKKEKERREKELKRANSKLNFYLGAYPLGLITKTEKMDFGAAFNIINAEKNALEFSFLKIQQKRDNYFDIWMMEKKYAAENLSYWDGYYSHFQYKIFSKNSPKLYNGILLGYANKDFEPMTVTTVNNQTNAEGTEVFDPTMRQAIIMLNEGYMSLYKGFGIDVFFGVGATFNQFDRGNTTFNSETHTVKDNNVLQYRKDQYVSFIMRFGLTIGLNIGNGNQ